MFLACLGLAGMRSLAGIGGPVPGLNATTPYLIYYGNWNATQVDFARNNYRLVIVHPQSNISASQIATIRRGPDNIAGTADDLLVLAYISIGEDNRPGVPFVGDGQGPRVDPRASDSVPLSSITNALGLPETVPVGKLASVPLTAPLVGCVAENFGASTKLMMVP